MHMSNICVSSSSRCFGPMHFSSTSST